MKFINSKVGLKTCERVRILALCFSDSHVLIPHLLSFRHSFTLVCLTVYDEDSVEVAGNSSTQ